MQILTIANQKGGVGKTTTAVNLAASLAHWGKKVLVVDLDAQASCTKWLGVTPQDGRTAYEMLTRRVRPQDCIYETGYELDLIPADLALAGLDLEIASEVRREERLHQSLSKIHHYDIAVVDSPPNLAVTTLNALAAATEIIIPVQCATEAWDAVSRLLNTLRRLFEELDRVTMVRALPTFLESTNISREVHEMIQREFEVLCLSPIHKNVRLAEAAARQKPILYTDRTASGCSDYLRVAKEIISALEKTEIRQASIRQ